MTLIKIASVMNGDVIHLTKLTSFGLLEEGYRNHGNLFLDLASLNESLIILCIACNVKGNVLYLFITLIDNLLTV